MPLTSNATRFLSVSEAALRFQVSAATVRRWVHDGRIAAVQPAGERGAIRISEDELARLTEPPEDR